MLDIRWIGRSAAGSWFPVALARSRRQLSGALLHRLPGRVSSMSTAGTSAAADSSGSLPERAMRWSSLRSAPNSRSCARRSLSSIRRISCASSPALPRPSMRCRETEMTRRAGLDARFGVVAPFGHRLEVGLGRLDRRLRGGDRCPLLLATARRVRRQRHTRASGRAGRSWPVATAAYSDPRTLSQNWCRSSRR